MFFFQSLRGHLSNPTFCGSNSYPKQGTNVCLIRYSIYSTLKTLPIVEEVDLWFCRSLGNLKHFSLSPQFPGLLFFGWLLTRVMWAAGPAWSNGAVGGCCHGGVSKSDVDITQDTKGNKTTPSVKWTNPTHFVCFLGLFSASLNVLILLFLYAWMLFENNENWNKALSNFYLLISILLRTRTKDIDLESCNNM